MKKNKEILSVKGVDSCFIGPNDLAWSMGVKVGDTEYEAAIMEVLKAAKEVGTPAGIHCMTPEDANKLIKQGFQLIALSTDSTFLASAAQSAFSKLKL